MTLGWRISLGLVIGSTAVLIIHPRSRPLYQLYVTGYGYSAAVSQSPYLPENLAVLAMPKNETEASLWMQVGAKRLSAGKPLTARELRSLSLVANHFSEVDVDNAFWLQMGAVFEAADGHTQRSLELWKRAAEAIGWHDYQSERLNTIVAEMASETGGKLAWHYARTAKLRSDSPARAIENYAKTVLSSSDLISANGLKARYVTLRNGVLLRDGSGSLESGKSGQRIIESSCVPVQVLMQFTPRTLQLARFQFINNLTKSGLTAEAENCKEAFRTNEAWLALTAREDPAEVFSELALTSVGVAVLPGASLILAILGLVTAAFGELMRRTSALQFVLKAPFVQIVGFALAIAAYAATQMPLFALTLALSFTFASYYPEQTRSKPPEYLGPLFRFTLVVLGIVFSLLVCCFLIGLTAPTLEVFTVADVPAEFIAGQTLPLGLAGLVLSLLLLVGPSWAMVLRIPTPVVLAKAVKEFGMTVLYIGVTFAVVLAPVALWVDARISDTLYKLLTNEPIYYLQQ